MLILLLHFLVAESERGCTVQLSSTGSTGTASYIASSIGTAASGASGTSAGVVRCGTPTNPWIVEAESGQRINVSLLDFGTVSAVSPTSASSSSSDQNKMEPPGAADGAEDSQTTSDVDALPCSSTYGYIVEHSDTSQQQQQQQRSDKRRRNVTICAGGHHRERIVHQTLSHVIQVVTSYDDAPSSESTGNERHFIFRFEGKAMSYVLNFAGVVADKCFSC